MGSAAVADLLKTASKTNHLPVVCGRDAGGGRGTRSDAVDAAAVDDHAAGDHAAAADVVDGCYHPLKAINCNLQSPKALA